MEQLIRLQKIDTKLKDLNDLLGDLPSKVEDLNRQEESVKSSIVDKKTRSKELDLGINKIELDVSEIIGKIDKLKDQLFLVTNNKQYDALMAEIDHLKEQKSNFENDLIELMEEKETNSDLINKMESELESLTENLIVGVKNLNLLLRNQQKKKLHYRANVTRVLKILIKIL
tara:strand:+ start:177 stop:692 length:516 start_codon:yes stop_codon:yes gene_type:complete